MKARSVDEVQPYNIYIKKKKKKHEGIIWKPGLLIKYNLTVFTSHHDFKKKKTRGNNIHASKSNELSFPFSLVNMTWKPGLLMSYIF